MSPEPLAEQTNLAAIGVSYLVQSTRAGAPLQVQISLVLLSLVWLFMRWSG